MKFKNEFQIIYFNTFSGEFKMSLVFKWKHFSDDRVIMTQTYMWPFPIDRPQFRDQAFTSRSMDFRPFFVVAYNSIFEIILVTECGGK